jgi:redox-sensitive bicupin YhaK (pirin superfamily)
LSEEIVAMTTLTAQKDRPITTVHTAFRTLEGDGFEVRRAIPAKAYEAIGPFIFLDHFGPIEFLPGEAKGASAHPHAGIETLTLLLEGRSIHKDSLGNMSVMQPGEVQWMRAGRGIIHDEGPDAEIQRTGGRNHGIQLWLNIPKGRKHDDPAYRHFTAGEIPVVHGDKGTARVVAGHVNGVTGPLESFGSPVVIHASLKAGGAITLETDTRELALYVMTGAAVIAGQAVSPGELARFGDGDAVTLTTDQDSEILLVGGDPLDAPIVRHGPFVMNTIDELERAVRDYYAGRMGVIV